MDRQLFRTPNARRQPAPTDTEQDPETGLRRNTRRNERRDSTEGELAALTMLRSESRNSDDDSLLDDDDIIPGAPSWDDDDDDDDDSVTGEHEGGDGRAHSRDRRKTVDLTTPTLVDEDYEEEEEGVEEEIVSLQHGDLRHNPNDRFIPQDESKLRRTPGASMYESSLQAQLEQQRIAALRRTPGASMHRSVALPPASTSTTTAIAQLPSKEGSVRDFGVPLATPVASSKVQKANRHCEEEASFSSASCSSSHQAEEIEHQHQQQEPTSTNRPPLAPGSAARPPSDQGIYPYTPAGWTLSRDPNLQVTHGAFSPNTIRLTESLDNILNDEEDRPRDMTPGYQARQRVFRGTNTAAAAAAAAAEKAEPSDVSPRVMYSNVAQDGGKSGDEASITDGWTTSYIFDNDGGKATMQKTPPSKTTRSRRGGSARRNRNPSSRPGSTRHNDQVKPTGMLFSPQQPQPGRGTAATPTTPAKDFDFATKHGVHHRQQMDGREDESGRSSPQPLNFATFVPASKDNMKNMKRPVASSARGPTYEASVQAASSRSKPKAKPPADGDPTLLSSSESDAEDETAEQQQPVVMHRQHQYSSFSHLPPNAHPFVPTFGVPMIQPMAQPMPHQMAQQTMAQSMVRPMAQTMVQPMAQPMAQPMPQPMPQQQMPQTMVQPMAQQMVQPGYSGQAPFHPQYQSPPPPMEYHHGQMNSMYGFPSNPVLGHLPPQSLSSFPMDPHSMPSFQGHLLPPPQHFAPQPSWPQMMPPPPPPPPPPPHFSVPTMHRDGSWHASSSTGWGTPVSEFSYGMFPQPGSTPRIAMSPSPPSVPMYSENDLAASMAQMHFSGSYSGEITTLQAQQQQFHGSQDNSFSSRPRVRSVDALSPASVPRRDRMQSWDSTRGSEFQARKDATQRKASSRRQQRAQNKNKKNETVEDKPLFQTTQGKKGSTPLRKKKQSNLRTPSPAESISLRGKKKEDTGRASPADDHLDQKRAEVNLTPENKKIFKVFSSSFHSKERSSVQEAEKYALESLKDDSLPEQVHWKVRLELADLAKRTNRFDEARTFYKEVCEMQPYASEVWLDYSKFEEECGRLQECARILQKGLDHCELNEALLIRAIKHGEKTGNLSGARQLLARLKHASIEKVSRAILEGALLEARAGNTLNARRVLKYLIHHQPWYGPLYLEAYRLERDLGQTPEALETVERGLKAQPRYGPLWFGAFRLCETLDMEMKEYEMPRTSKMLDRAAMSISRELIWKVHLGAAQIFERAAILKVADKQGASLNSELIFCREKFGMTVLTCPPKLCWKVWLAGGRMELSAGNTEQARMLFLRAHHVVPEKSRATALLECARLEEFVGETKVARAILCKARSEIGSDWKVWLESVLLEIRSGKHRRAIELVKRALDMHSGTGRLWASLVQLHHLDGEETQCDSLRHALLAVPKSGEVWCEGSRMHLNPFTAIFDPAKARCHLHFATKFTPQYGDSFLESLKLEILDQLVVPPTSLLWDVLKDSILKDLPPNEIKDDEFDQIVVRCVRTALRSITAKVDEDTQDVSSSNPTGTIDSKTLKQIRAQLHSQAWNQDLDVSELELRCANADPNYGLLWFHCRQSPTDNARTIFARAKEKLRLEIGKHIFFYVAAMTRRYVVAAMLNHYRSRDSNDQAAEKTSNNTEDSAKALDEKLLLSPTLDKIFSIETEHEELNVALLKSTTSSDFITGLQELNKFTPLGSLTLLERRKTLFGSDSLLT